MALRDRAVNALRAVFGFEREERAKADSPSTAAARNLVPSMFSVWGREDIGGLLTVSQSLMDRFADYEAMEEYPDINCVAEGMRVYVMDGSVCTPTPIEQIATDDDQPTILAYDVETGKIVATEALHAKLTGRQVEVVALRLSNGSTLRVTAEHKILTVDRGYADAQDLVSGDKIISMYGGFDQSGLAIIGALRVGQLEVVGNPHPAGQAKVYDITTGTHNFVCEGAVIHNSAFRYFANDATQPSVKDGRTIWTRSDDAALVGIGDDLLHKVLRVEDEIWSQAYGLGMMGNDFLELLITENGVIGTNLLPVPTVRRVERLDGGLIGFVQDITGKFTANGHELRRMLAGHSQIPANLALFEDWQVAHFRMRATRRRSPYGVSVAEGARWIWKRLVMLEDSVMIYKLTRAPARFVYRIDVTDVPVDKVEGFLRQAKQSLKKKKMVNPRTGRLDMRYNAIARDEDIFIAVRDGKELAGVDVLAGPDYQSMDDVEYFKKMLHGTLNVPRDYLGQEGGIPGKSILSNDDVRAARVTLNLQRELRLGWERIIRTHLAARGVRHPWQPEFSVEMTIPSGIWELAAYETMNAAADYASRVQPWVSTRWIQENVLKLTDDAIKAIEKEQKKDAEEEQDGELPSYAGGAPPGEEGGEPPPEGEEASPEEEPEEEPAEGEPKPKPKPAPKFGKPAIKKGTAKTPEEQKRYSHARRLEERRDKESRRRHQEIVDKLGTILSSDDRRDREFAHRDYERRGFFADLKRIALREQNGRMFALPSSRGPRGSR